MNLLSKQEFVSSGKSELRVRITTAIRASDRRSRSLKVERAIQDMLRRHSRQCECHDPISDHEQLGEETIAHFSGD
jgi:hypothetical protein